MAILDNILDLLQHGASAIGAGGGIAAGELYRRFRKGIKTADEAKKSVAKLELSVITRLELTSIIEKLKTEVNDQLIRIARSSQSELQLKPDQETSNRLAQLETRMSALEDDFDVRNKEDTQWNREMERSLGRIEGAVGTRKPNG